MYRQVDHNFGHVSLPGFNPFCGYRKLIALSHNENSMKDIKVFYLHNNVDYEYIYRLKFIAKMRSGEA